MKNGHQCHEAVILIPSKCENQFLMSKPFPCGWKEDLPTKRQHRGTLYNDGIILDYDCGGGYITAHLSKFLEPGITESEF